VKIHVGFDLTYESAHPTPMIFMWCNKKLAERDRRIAALENKLDAVLTMLGKKPQKWLWINRLGVVHRQPHRVTQHHDK
jgi:hypothetical protein